MVAPRECYKQPERSVCAHGVQNIYADAAEEVSPGPKHASMPEFLHDSALCAFPDVGVLGAAASVSEWSRLTVALTQTTTVLL